MDKEVVDIEDSIKTGKSIFHWLPPGWERPSCSQRNMNVMGLWKRLMVNWCSTQGSKWIFEECQCVSIGHRALVCFLYVSDLHTQKLILIFLRKGSWKVTLLKDSDVTCGSMLSVHCGISHLFLPPLINQRNISNSWCETKYDIKWANFWNISCSSHLCYREKVMPPFQISLCSI